MGKGLLSGLFWGCVCVAGLVVLTGALAPPPPRAPAVTQQVQSPPATPTATVEAEETVDDARGISAPPPGDAHPVTAPAEAAGDLPPQDAPAPDAPPAVPDRPAETPETAAERAAKPDTPLPEPTGAEAVAPVDRPQAGPEEGRAEAAPAIAALPADAGAPAVPAPEPELRDDPPTLQAAPAPTTPPAADGPGLAPRSDPPPSPAAAPQRPATGSAADSGTAPAGPSQDATAADSDRDTPELPPMAGAERVALAPAAAALQTPAPPESVAAADRAPALPAQPSPPSPTAPEAAAEASPPRLGDRTRGDRRAGNAPETPTIPAPALPERPVGSDLAATAPPRPPAMAGAQAAAVLSPTAAPAKAAVTVPVPRQVSVNVPIPLAQPAEAARGGAAGLPPTTTAVPAPPPPPSEASAERTTNVSTRRLPQIEPPATDTEAPAVEAEEVPAPPETASDMEPGAPVPPALIRFAAPFERDDRPLFAPLLLDDGLGADARARLAALPFPASIALDPAAPGATAAAAAYRAAGKEVVILATQIPPQATAADLEVTFASHRITLPEAVALLDLPEGGFQDNRRLTQQIGTILVEEGLGLITHDRGLNPAAQMASRGGLPHALVFRSLAEAGDTPATLLRLLERARFRAGQQGAVVLLVAGSGAELDALLDWLAEGRGEVVALAPVSAVLMADP